MKRRAIPFTPLLRGESGHAEQAAKQLNQLIDQLAQQGWDFVQLESVTSMQPGGCLGFTPAKIVNVQVAVFEQPEA